jgi:hypothetical protein
MRVTRDASWSCDSFFFRGEFARRLLQRLHIVRCRAIGIPYLARLHRDLVQRTTGLDRGDGFRQRIAARSALGFVVDLLDQQPVVARFGAGPLLVAAHAHQRPFALHALAVHHDFQVPGLEVAFRIAALRAPRAAIP